MRALLIAGACALLSCRGAAPAPSAPTPTPTPAVGAAASAPIDPASVIQYDDQGRRLSRGFLPPSRDPDAGSEASRAKLVALDGAEAQRRLELVPAELRARPAVTAGDAAAVAVYRDGVFLRAIDGSALAAPTALDALLTTDERAGLRSVLAFSPAGGLWLGPEQLDSRVLRVNKMGRIKLEPASRARKHGTAGGSGDGKGPGTGGGTGKGTGTGDRKGAGGAAKKPDRRAMRSEELQSVIWLELRSDASPRLHLEPDDPAEDASDR